MACGICHEAGHRRETCPKKKGAAVPAAGATVCGSCHRRAAGATVCGGCHRRDGTHSPKCSRGKGSGTPAPAPTTRAPGSIDFPEPIEKTITRFETHAAELERRAKAIRDAIAVLRDVPA